MEILQKSLISSYLNIHSIDELFSFNILPHLQLMKFDRGEMIIKEGDAPEYLYYVIQGKAKIYITQQNGKVMLLNFISTGAFIGELELLQDAHYSKGVQTSTETICFAIRVQDVREQLFHDAKFLRLLSTYLSHKASMHSSRFSQGLAFPLENRLAEFILISANDGLYKEKHTEVCEHLGVSYRHLLYVIAQFIDKGLLQKNGRSYIISNETALQEMATVTHHLDISLLQLAKKNSKR